jgi:hypothetical protein
MDMDMDMDMGDMGAACVPLHVCGSAPVRIDVGGE